MYICENAKNVAIKEVHTHVTQHRPSLWDPRTSFRHWLQLWDVWRSNYCGRVHNAAGARRTNYIREETCWRKRCEPRALKLTNFLLRYIASKSHAYTCRSAEHIRLHKGKTILPQATRNCDGRITELHFCHLRNHLCTRSTSVFNYSGQGSKQAATAMALSRLTTCTSIELRLDFPKGALVLASAFPRPRN